MHVTKFSIHIEMCAITNVSRSEAALTDLQRITKGQLPPTDRHSLGALSCSGKWKHSFHTPFCPHCCCFPYYIASI